MNNNNKQKIDLSKLPKWEKGEGMGIVGSINWEKSIGKKVTGFYENIEFEIDIINYNKKKHILSVEYNNKEFSISTDSFKACKLGRIIGKITKDFKLKIGQTLKDSKRNITITDRKYRQKEQIDKQGRKSIANEKWYKYTCNVCGWTEGWMIEPSLLKGNNCRCCTNQIAVLGINTIWDTDRWMCDLGVSDEDAKTHTHGSTDIIKIFNADINEEKFKKISEIYRCHSIDNPCFDKISYPNKFSYKLLSELNKTYKLDYIEHEYSPNWIGLKRYDNYFIYQGKEYILEMDGHFHNKDNNLSGQTKEESKAIDDYKDRLAKQHGINVIRIDCDYNDISKRFEYIQNNILNNDKLSELFDLNKIDWIKCGEFACSNLIKIACEYKKNNPKLTTTEIGRIMGFSQTGISNWLKQGIEYNWCEYDPKYETKLSLEKGRISNRIPLEVFKDNISFGIFESATYLEKHSEKLFGVKFVRACITQSCLNKPKYMRYKGYEFNYITQEEYNRRKAEENLKQAI